MTFLPEDKETRLQSYRNVLQNWNVEGYIEFKERPAEWLRVELAGYSLREIKRLLFEHVKQGGKIDEVVETREDYTSFQFHYDLRIPIEGRRIYFETILLCEDANDFTIRVVSVKDG